MLDFNKFYFNEQNKEAFIEEAKKELNLLVEEESASVQIDPNFVARLANYLEQKFPNYGEFDIQVANEIRKHMKGDNSYVKKVKKRIHEIINKCKAKFLHDLTNKVEKIKVQPKDPAKPPPISQNPLGTSEEPEAGEMPPNV